jgi:alcohol dehydrogenase/propanol-preferring alcohol dehydrogenase
MMAKWARTRVIAVDVAAEKFDACRKAGADEVVDASKGNVAQALLDLTHGAGVDVAIDYVSSSSTLAAGVKALGRRGRLVILGGAAQRFEVPSRELLLKEQDVLGSRYVTRAEILETLDLVARREVWPLVTEIRPLEEAEALHERLEQGKVTGRAALLIK